MKVFVTDARARAQQLIGELDGRARANALACLMLILPHASPVVWSNEVNRLQRVESLIRDGARPLGFVGLTEFKTKYLFWVEPVSEYQENPEIWHALLRLLAGINNRARKLKVSVGGKKVGY
jgi:hypothetical protein